MSSTKILHLVRHGKALQDYRSIDDIDRPLIEKGILNNIAVATRLFGKYGQPDRIISSPAARALHTAHIFARMMNYAPENVGVIKELYSDGEKTVWDILSEMPEDIDSLMFVGHNPDMTYLAGTFLRSLTDSLPTSGVASIRFEAAQWRDIRRATATGEIMHP